MTSLWITTSDPSEAIPNFEIASLLAAMTGNRSYVMKNGKTESLYHVAIAVKNIDEVSKLYEVALGLKVTHTEVVGEQGVKAAMLEPESGGTAIELLEPLSDNSPISKFLEKRGEGIHHICFLVDDIELALERLKKEGIQLIDQSPRPGAHGTRVAFLHPKALKGVLIEIAERNKVQD